MTTHSRRLPKDSAEAMVKVAVAAKLVGESLGMIPEIMPMFGRASAYFHEIVVEEMGAAALRFDPEGGLAVMQRCVAYLVAKGVEAVYLWGRSPDGHIEVDFEPGQMARMELDSKLPSAEHRFAQESMKIGLMLFDAHRSFMEAKMRTMASPTRPS